MAKNKTTESEANVEGFINAVKDETRREDCFSLIKIINHITKLEPKMWGPSIIGFGSYHYKYESGREGDSAAIAFSPRASSITIYLSGSFDNREALLQQFGKHKTDKGCVHIKTLADINEDVLIKMIVNHIKHIKETYPDK
jgi:hypothetical protein